MFFILISLVYRTSISDILKEIYMKCTVAVKSLATFLCYDYSYFNIWEIQ